MSTLSQLEIRQLLIDRESGISSGVVSGVLPLFVTQATVISRTRNDYNDWYPVPFSLSKLSLALSFSGLHILSLLPVSISISYPVTGRLQYGFQMGFHGRTLLSFQGSGLLSFALLWVISLLALARLPQ